MGRGEKFPPQFGQTPFKTVSAHCIAKRAFISANPRVPALRRKIPVTTLTIRTKFQHATFLAQFELPFLQLSNLDLTQVNCISEGKTLHLISDACEHFIPAFVIVADVSAAVILDNGNDLKIRFPAKDKIYVFRVKGKTNEPFPACYGYPMCMSYKSVERHLWENVIIRQRFGQNAKKNLSHHCSEFSGKRDSFVARMEAHFH